MKNVFVTRGRNKGMLLAKCPPVNTPEAATWLAIMSKANPFKVGMGHMLFMDDSNRKVYNETLDAIKDLDVRGLDRDRNALEKLGVW